VICAVVAAAAYNFHLLLKWMELFLSRFLAKAIAGPSSGLKTKTSRRTSVAKLLTATRIAPKYHVGGLLSAKLLEKGRLLFAKPARVREMENH
jgi:hypothetical protein